MSRDDDWYRSDEWSDEVEEQFRARLARCRSEWNRSQYLRLKALALLESDDAPKIRAARDLLLEWLDQDKDLQLPLVHQSLGSAYERLGDSDRALSHYERAAETELNPPEGVKVGAQSVLEFASAEARIRGQLRDSTFDLLMSELDRDPESIMTFPASRYRLAAVLAEEFQRRKDSEAARSWAKVALDAADASSPFPRRRDVGIANATADERSRLEQLAAETRGE
jgi:tetratricopeptide (TPR) repeat protein